MYIRGWMWGFFSLSLFLLPDGYKLFLKHHKYHLTHIHDALSILHHPNALLENKSESVISQVRIGKATAIKVHMLPYGTASESFYDSFAHFQHWFNDGRPPFHFSVFECSRLRWFQSLDYELWSFNWWLNFAQVNCVMHQPVNLPLLHSDDAMNQA